MDSQRLLVIDDSPTVRKLVELTFRGSPWQVDYAASGGEGLLLAKRALPQVVLLDFMLPDMRGVDVCEKLARDEQTRAIPVVVMSGKESVSELFKNFSAVTACLAKPSTSEQIRKQVDAAAASTRPNRASAPPRPSFAQKEAAAKALYALLRGGLGKIPDWMKELGDASPAPFFARKLLTPQLSAELFDALVPHVRGLLATPEAPSSVAPVPAPPGEGSFQGSTRGWPLAALINFFESSARTGSLTLSFDGKETILYMRGGEILAVTNRDALEYLRGLKPVHLKAVPPEAMEAATAEQRNSGTPVIVTLAAKGYFPANALAETLGSRGRRLLVAALASPQANFSWRDLDVLPSYVEAHGRHISTSRNTLPFGPEEQARGKNVSGPQQALEGLRKSPSPRSFDKSVVFERARGFSQSIQQFTLTAAERQALALVDGRHSAEEIAGFAGLDTAEALTILTRLVEVHLLADTGLASRDEHRKAARARPVMILEPDVEGFQQPLASLLRNRTEPIALLDLAGERDLLAAVQRERPRAVLLNAGATSINTTLHTLRSQPDLADVALVAVLEPEMAAQSSVLAGAGFDSVLVKPINRAEIERLFA